MVRGSFAAMARLPLFFSHFPRFFFAVPKITATFVSANHNQCLSLPSGIGHLLGHLTVSGYFYALFTYQPIRLPYPIYQLLLHGVMPDCV